MSDRFCPIRRAAPTAPGFSEAYPRLDSVRAQHAWRAGTPVCVWTAPKRGVGQLEITAVQPGQKPEWLVAEYRIMDDPAVLPYAYGEAHFDLEVIPAGYKELRWYFRCPVCRKRKKMLVFGRSWACQRCHGLHARSQLVDSRVILREKWVELRQLLGDGRPKGMHNAKYRRLCAERDELERQIGGADVLVASGVHSRVVTPHWMTAAEAERL